MSIYSFASPQTPMDARTSRPVALRPGRHVPAVTLIAAMMLAACGSDDDAPVAAAPAPAPAPVTTTQASARSLCESYLGRSIEGAVITAANLVAATAAEPEHCKVKGEMPQDLDFEVRLPTAWNKRTVFIGGGGFDGSITGDPGQPHLSPGMAQGGYATIATNHGHTGGIVDGSFALNTQMLADYAYLSVPRVLASATAILKERYGNDFVGTKMVYEGCSGGGRQALIQAQRYPDLFDGIIARAPANAYNPQFLWYQKVSKQLARPGAALSTAKINTIANAVMTKCDALDGLSDKIIGRPEACNFDPVELACAGTETDACLTPTQVESARVFYAPTSVADGRYIWPGFPVGGESDPVFGWPTPFRAFLGEEYMKYMVTQTSAPATGFDWLQVDPAVYTSRIDQLVTMIDAVDPDLSRFKARGGKLILWTGLSDWLITARNATGYYQSVVQKSGSQAAADEFVEYYTSPSVQHCSSGTGADKIDFVGPVFDWIEKGIKPSSKTIVAGQNTVPAGTTPFTRPVCQYSKFPKYMGGDPNAASSFQCSAS
jgi:hypothetical protein